MKLLLPVLISLALSACAASGPEPGQSEPVQAAGAGGAGETPAAMTDSVAAGEEIICERVKPTGSRVAVRVCRTRAEIEERERLDQEALRRGTRNNRSGLD